MKVYTPEELAHNDGAEERPALVAVDGKVYDVSQSKRWIKGGHMKRHQAGTDLTADIKGAPHGPEVLDRLTLVGTLQEDAVEPREGLRGRIDVWLQRIPFLQRHPHPAIVHVPVGMSVAVPVLYIVAVLADSARTEWASFCCLVLMVCAIPLAMATGYFTWWINYDRKDSFVIKTKRRLAWPALGLGLFAVLLRAIGVSDPLLYGQCVTGVYLVVTFSVCVMVTVVGFLGGRLTFPY